MKQWWKKHAGQAAGVLVLLILAGFGLTYWRRDMGCAHPAAGP